MLPHFDAVIQPLLAATGAGPWIEIGAAGGDTTERLAELAAERGIVLHSVDPDPQFDVAEYEQRFGESFRFHRGRSLDVLGQIEPAAAVLIDGDHNWYTVHGELIMLERVAAAANRHLPLIILHDVEWPYARRDMYYDPEAIPAESRQPWERRGISWATKGLDESGKGFNSRFANAIEEGGPRNGVLTAVEDFIDESTATVRLRIIRGDFGIGVLVSDDLLASSPPLQHEWERLNSSAFLLAEAERLSTAMRRLTVLSLEAFGEVPTTEPGSGDVKLH